MMSAEPSIEDKIPFMINILNKFSYQLDMMAYLNKIETKLDPLSCIRYDIFKIKLNSHNNDIISNLESMKTELKKLNEIVILNTISLDKLNSTQVNKLNDLNRDILERLDEMKILIGRFPKNNYTYKILDLCDKLKPSKLDLLLQTPSEVATLFSVVVLLVQLYQQYEPV
jgi:hypothetical protein